MGKVLFMPSQHEVRRESANILRFLQEQADARGIVRASQKVLAEEYGASQTRFHRQVHRLVNEKKVRVGRVLASGPAGTRA
jgi:hypothetical protein